jgi:hypothetical protein
MGLIADAIRKDDPAYRSPSEHRTGNPPALPTEPPLVTTLRGTRDVLQSALDLAKHANETADRQLALLRPAPKIEPNPLFGDNVTLARDAHAKALFGEVPASSAPPSAADSSRVRDENTRALFGE